MLIYESQKSRSIERIRFWAVLGLLTGLFVLAGFYLWSEADLFRKGGISCNAEKVVTSGSGDEVYFLNKGQRFYNGHTQSSVRSRSGKYSSRLTGDNKYGIRYDLLDPVPGKFYHASVWRYQSGTRTGILVASDPTGKSLYKRTIIPTIENENGWDRLDLKFFVPFHKETDVIRVYVSSSGAGEVFFDDFELKEVPFEADSLFAGKPVDHLKISINEDGFRKLENKRTEALNIGILKTTDDDWVKGKLAASDPEPLEIRLRLKGDFLDHLQEDKWSFRIKVKDPHSWNGLKTFSIQHPATREYLKEWVFHHALEREGILTTGYDFALVSLNNRELGLYAWEEHFEKQLVESRQRREGPILRFSEDAYFEGIGRDYAVFGNDLNKGNRNETEAAEVLPFTESKIKASGDLKTQFEKGKILVEAFRYNTLPPGTIFDLDKMAKFFALVDMTQAYHAIIWHNLRFYHNPLLGKLEPVAFDGFGISLSKWKNRPFFGYGIYHPDYDGLEMYKNLFLDKKFTSKYLSYLKKFTSKEYVENFLIELEPGLQSREALLQSEFPEYEFDREAFLINALRINELLFPVHENHLRALPQKEQKDSLIISISNYWYLPLEIKGTGRTASELEFRLTDPVWTFADKKGVVPETLNVTVPIRSKYVFYTIPGSDTTFSARILDNPGPESGTFLPVNLSQQEITSTEIFDVEGPNITFRKGKYRISQPIIIPEGKKVIIPAGCELDLVSGAAFVSFSPVEVTGFEELPVVITSSDKQNGGFSVFKAGGRSTLVYTLFENLDAYASNGQTTTGAVNFYEADVEILNSSFTGNLCEDALNIIRSEFTIHNTVISNTFGDGFDADFCKGSINNSRFLKTTNDGIDVSGSVIDIENCLIDNTGDKGISVGERSTVTIHSAKIVNSPVAIASKDLSEVFVNYVELINCTTGFSAYQKKPEFGSAQIEVKKYKAKDVQSLFLSETGSLIKMPD